MVPASGRPGRRGAQNNLGVMYAGQGVPRVAGEAVKLFQRAAGQGDVHAQNNLGVMYVNGQGVARDIVAASNWLALAEAALGGSQCGNRAGEDADA